MPQVQAQNPNPHQIRSTMTHWMLVPRQLTLLMEEMWEMCEQNGVKSPSEIWQVVMGDAPSVSTDSFASQMANPRPNWAMAPRLLTPAMKRAWEAAPKGASYQEILSSVLAVAPKDPAQYLQDQDLPAPPEHPQFPSSRVLVERGFLGVKHFDTEEEHEAWKAKPWWKRF